MNIFIREIKRNKASFFIWLSINLFMSVYMVILYPSFNDGGLTEIISVKFPPAMQKAFGMNLSLSSDILGFFCIMVPFLLLFDGVYVTMLFSSILSKEENDGTIEFLLSKPVSRSGVAFSKLMAGLFYVTAFVGITWLATYILFEITGYSDYSKKAFLFIAIGQYFGHLYFAAIGFALSTFIYRSRTVIPLSVGIAIGLFIMQSLSEFGDKAGFLKYITPFEFFKPDYIFINKTFETKYLIINFAVIFICLVIGFIRYNTKDIK